MGKCGHVLFGVGAVLCASIVTVASAAAPSSHDVAPKISHKSEMVFSANQGEHNLSVYKVDEASGGLIEAPGSPYATGKFPVSVSVTPNRSEEHTSELQSQ